MRHLARTLLILGSVTACERSHPDCDPAPRAQTRLATPLVDVHGAPAVGNIGQTGAPMTVQRPARRVQRVGRTATMPRPGTSAVAVQPDPLQQPDADVRVEMPARVPPSRTTRLEFQRDDSAKFSLTHERPLVNRRERPAHANMGRRAYIPERGE